MFLPFLSCFHSIVSQFSGLRKPAKFGLDNRVSALYNMFIRIEGNKYAHRIAMQRVAGWCKAISQEARNTSRSTIPNAVMPVGGRRYAGYSVQPVSAGDGGGFQQCSLERKWYRVFHAFPTTCREGVFYLDSTAFPPHSAVRLIEGGETPWHSTFSTCSRSAALSPR